MGYADDAPYITLGVMNEQRITAGASGIPPELDATLPWWLRRQSSWLVNPTAVGGALGLVLGYSSIGAVLLVVACGLTVSSFWIARALLRRRGKWSAGTWHAEVLPSIHRVRAIFFSLALLAGIGVQLVVVEKLRMPALSAFTVVALAVLVPVFIWGSIANGFVGTSPSSVSYREKQPFLFWTGLVMYSTIAGAVVVVLIYVILRGAAP